MDQQDGWNLDVNRDDSCSELNPTRCPPELAFSHQASSIEYRRRRRRQFGRKSPDFHTTDRVANLTNRLRPQEIIFPSRLTSCPSCTSFGSSSLELGAITPWGKPYSAISSTRASRKTSYWSERGLLGSRASPWVLRPSVTAVER